MAVKAPSQPRQASKPSSTSQHHAPPRRQTPPPAGNSSSAGAKAKAIPVYVVPGVNDDFLLKMQRPLRDDATAAMQKIYGDKPQPSEGSWLGYLIGLGMEMVLQRHDAMSKHKGAAAGGGSGGGAKTAKR